MKKLLLSAVLMTIPAVSFAGSPGVYIGGELGAGWLHDNKADEISSGTRTKLGYEEDLAGGAAVGYKFNNGFRTEFDLDVRRNAVDKAVGVTTVRGDTNAVAATANIFYDLENSSRFTPFIGAGVGAAYVDVDHMNIQNGLTVNDDAVLPVAQGTAGISYAINDNLDVYANYKYITSIDNNNSHYNTTTGSRVDLDYHNSSALLGLRYSFGQPAQPAPQPVAEYTPPSPPVMEYSPQDYSRSYLAFFDFDKSDLTPEAVNVIRKAFEDATSGKFSRIEVTGHADRSGTNKYNMGLSKRRAEIVRAELVKMGISVDDISIYAKGEEEPLVPTADGVREPQNRRVEIVYTVKK